MDYVLVTWLLDRTLGAGLRWWANGRGSGRFRSLVARDWAAISSAAATTTRSTARVLARYVQMATETRPPPSDAGRFPEGGLSRTGPSRAAQAWPFLLLLDGFRPGQSRDVVSSRGDNYDRS